MADDALIVDRSGVALQIDGVRLSFGDARLIDWAPDPASGRPAATLVFRAGETETRVTLGADQARILKDALFDLPALPSGDLP